MNCAVAVLLAVAAPTAAFVGNGALVTSVRHSQHPLQINAPLVRPGTSSQHSLSMSQASESDQPQQAQVVAVTPSAKRASYHKIVTVFSTLALNVILPMTGLFISPKAGENGGLLQNVVQTAEAAPRRRRVARTGGKMSKVPIFMITNENGQPFLSQAASGHQVGLMFTHADDAKKMLKEILSAPNMGKSGAKVFITNLERAFQLAVQPGQRSGLKGDGGEELMMYMRFSPSNRELMSAKMAKTKKGDITGLRKPIAIPCFSAEGLTIRKRGTDVKPVFMSRSDLDEMWSKVVEQNPELPKTPEVAVHDLVSVMVDIHNGEKSMKDVDIFAPSDSIKFKQSQRGTRSAKIVMAR